MRTVSFPPLLERFYVDRSDRSKLPLRRRARFAEASSEQDAKASMAFAPPAQAANTRRTASSRPRPEPEKNLKMLDRIRQRAGKVRDLDVQLAPCAA